eukprot:NODE_87_length_3753_cov_8.767237.p1 GENE.NODE_87_length_3753_cov_8.767237~~NODE_87_length_3753_cov_8.767237.p1  ORF type:complete len:1136 (-),score=285.29 NODE_87_length_3753_cov_8.767237:346-3681(-)
MTQGLVYRSAALAHAAAVVNTKEPLREATYNAMHKILSRAKLIMLLYLGPSEAWLELNPYDLDEADPVEIHMVPGMMMVIRTDLMSHKIFGVAGQGAWSLTTHMMVGENPLKRWGSTNLAIRSPKVEELDEWAKESQIELKENEAAPSRTFSYKWQAAMNRNYFKVQYMAVTGISIIGPGKELEPDNDLWCRMSLSGPDLVTQVPLTRWDVSKYFDPDVESWKKLTAPGKDSVATNLSENVYETFGEIRKLMGTPKCYCQHAGFSTGIANFDEKLFNISKVEAKDMDPCQRLLLETSYAALQESGYNKKTLAKKPISVFVGYSSVEWGWAHSVVDNPVAMLMGEAVSIGAMRVSFCLNIQGPSATVTLESASSLIAVHTCAQSLQALGVSYQKAGIAGGSYFNLAGFQIWPLKCAAGLLSAQGRCFNFDSSADGYVLADSTGMIALAGAQDDDIAVQPTTKAKQKDAYGYLCSTAANTNGKLASLWSPPNGPALQKLVAQAVQGADISAYNVDTGEAPNMGSILAEATQVTSLMRIHTDGGVRTEPYGLVNFRTSAGHANEACGVLALVKVMMCSAWGVMTPGIHLRQVNPYVDTYDSPVMMPQEIVAFGSDGVFSGVMSSGIGGSNSYTIQLTHQVGLQDPAQPGLLAIGDGARAIEAAQALPFWPASAGCLRDDEPERAYYICGTWSNWRVPEAMEDEGDGVWGYDLTLGENSWEHFQIWADGNSERCMYPGLDRFTKENVVLGPEKAIEIACWLVDGRGDAPKGGKTGQKTKPTGPVTVLRPFDHNANAKRRVTRLYGDPLTEPGWPGDRYRVKLHIDGRVRSVTWEKMKVADPSVHPYLNRAPRPSTADYYLTGTFNKWTLIKMKPTGEPGFYRCEVTMIGRNAQFLILRERDWFQSIVPVENGHDDLVAGGPMWTSTSSSLWNIDGEEGDVYEVRFDRRAAGGKDIKHVRVDKIRKDMITHEQELAYARTHYALVGSWDRWQTPCPMRWTGVDFQLYIQLGPHGIESFRVSQGLNAMMLFPSVHGSNTHVEHEILGPRRELDVDERACWTLGEHADDDACEGAIYDVRLLVGYDGCGEPERISWTRMDNHFVPDEEAIELYLLKGR